MESLNGMPPKARSNLTKHRVGFEAACLVFSDVSAVDRLDVGSGDVEPRYVITGMVNGVLLTVVYAERWKPHAHHFG